MARTEVLPAESRRPGRSETAAALSLAARMPRLILEARRVTASLAHGLHGRRRAGPGESFWQFRPFVTGEAAGRIDWRRSGRDDRLYVREREWETPHAVWLWIDRSASMAFRSDLAETPKIERAFVLGLALADTLVEAGERVGLLGLKQPTASRRVAEGFAQTFAARERDLDDDLPPATPIGRLDEAVIVSDFLSPLPELRRRVEAISSRGARGHLVMIVDPVEETFPFGGQAVLEEPEAGLRLRIGDAASWGASYRRRMAAHRGAIAELARARGWSVTIHHTDKPATQPALRVLTLVAGAPGTGGA
ncbi:DUF58 domain-containing protein [Enterovirga aerilata]|uniref:DUF58 domain-containing protein n=1 Tax=Enterovirga aerilata TaxID=2730920 RepID=A0A849I4E9_9HYPH|nr:DUF58 domain-containing protein [Enterovirga sp. DB1703]NNM71010.1 DUF58 domain-containing protein [Enterovirga sp. DB1703]